ncbi:hypothetical protein L6452_03709 [Arctium lappa]|uniref:Uncharacterized protein n=1 Tax=Arctium lappa TaxID=4217 RepID=A0ACB9FMD3_ARCLA|nr:hypothetical protein L6452_03709 [Arctium lappa]
MEERKESKPVRWVGTSFHSKSFCEVVKEKKLITIVNKEAGGSRNRAERRCVEESFCEGGNIDGKTGGGEFERKREEYISKEGAIAGKSVSVVAESPVANGAIKETSLEVLTNVREPHVGGEEATNPFSILERGSHVGNVLDLHQESWGVGEGQRDFSISLEEFGKKLGVSWEAVNEWGSQAKGGNKQ